MVRDCLRLLKLKFEDARDELMTATPTTFPFHQAHALAYQNMLREILTFKPLPKE